ncbi:MULTISPECIES: ABC transporter ATP-binding protein [Alphaproteobacteria]|uniref:ABC transporter ATP-binding protein n=2 Tax=Alphaproteobacteria TaxID=28211 RepID=A0A512HNQ2_9HYPH|nr:MULTISPECIES: ABC transporter ATP-binding protein [Alphaproteobacteria]GEO87082.1 ABC transporter ATP-binding protein [Ciceribacter naphthalenivorans]GLR23132.1 ABC transporter ATP-binding protein [Ciceribacter naphthalenivorans]GLT05988.1 ABC transporter ATP-binding protein [Sphingomonas psychrolutea]
MTAEPILSVRDTARYYPSGDSIVKALDGVSLDIHAGELVAIVGPSGSGKSTLLLIAGLLEPPTSGEVRIRGTLVSKAGENLDRLRDFRRRNIGFVFQKANLIPFLTASENVALAMEIDDVPAGDARRHAERLLAGLGLGHRVGNRPSKLSGGEQQRVAIARALANDPTLILADEPTAALDSARGRQVIELFRQIADTRGAAIVVVTHDPRSLDLFDRTIELTDGRISGELSRQDRLQAH